MKLSAELIEEYKEIRDVVQNGDFYRLNHTSRNNYYCYEYANESEAALFVFLPQTQIARTGVRIKLRGLDETATYTFMLAGAEVRKTGAYLMNHGIDVKLSGDYASIIIKFKKSE